MSDLMEERVDQLCHLLEDEDGLSRAEIAERMGLKRRVVTELTSVAVRHDRIEARGQTKACRYYLRRGPAVRIGRVRSIFDWGQSCQA